MTTSSSLVRSCWISTAAAALFAIPPGEVLAQTTYTTAVTFPANNQVIPAGTNNLTVTGTVTPQPPSGMAPPASVKVTLQQTVPQGQPQTSVCPLGAYDGANNYWPFSQ